MAGNTSFFMSIWLSGLSKDLLFLSDCQSSPDLAIRKVQNKRVLPTNTSFSKSLFLSFQPVLGLHHKAKRMVQYVKSCAV